MSTLGYTTVAEAIEQGFTHHGRYYGIPIYIGGHDGGETIVAAKHILLEPLFDLATMIEGVLGDMFFPDHEGFMFLVGARLDGRPD